jgi:hypothetical protein
MTHINHSQVVATVHINYQTGPSLHKETGRERNRDTQRLEPLYIEEFF